MQRFACAGLISAALLVSGCGGTAMVQYNKPPKDAGEYKFVIPRVVVRVEAGKVVSDKDAKTGRPATNAAGLTFTPVPVATDAKGAALPLFSVSDDSRSGFSLVSTSITNVAYVDNLIIQSIGTTITDNRKTIIDAAFGVLGIVAAGSFAAAEKSECANSLEEFKPTVLQDFQLTGPKQTKPMPSNPCWGYQVLSAADVAGTVESQPIEGEGGIPLGTKVGWFPYPACQYVKINVIECREPSTTTCQPKSEGRAFQTVIGVSDGKRYQKIALPPKGKVTMHSNFCVADVTSEPSPLASDWELANQVITNTKSLMSSKK